MHWKFATSCCHSDEPGSFALPVVVGVFLACAIFIRAGRRTMMVLVLFVLAPQTIVGPFDNPSLFSRQTQTLPVGYFLVKLFVLIIRFIYSTKAIEELKLDSNVESNIRKPDALISKYSRG